MQTLRIKWKDIVGNATGRIMLSILLFFMLMGGAFIIYTYTSQIAHFKKAEFSKLKAISTSLAIELNGDKHMRMWNVYQEMDEISANGQSPYYDEINAILQRTAKANKLNTDIYTIVFDSTADVFHFGVTSAEHPYYRHTWTEFDQAHIFAYNEGSTLGPYTDENGIWLSSFSPVKASDGTTVALLQVDEPFGNFIAQAEEKVLWNLGIILILLAIVVTAMLFVIQKIMVKEDQLKRLLSRQRNEIEIKNRDMMSSISRARMIQDALLPELNKVREIFPEMFVMFQPRDVVSGDFFWFLQQESSAYFAVADCTGHGVPGAFMSMIGHSLLNDIMASRQGLNPAEILTELDRKLTQMLNENGGSNTDGMDIALLRYDFKKNVLEFAGGMRPLVRVSGDKMEKISGDKFSIGGHRGLEKRFTNQRIKVQAGDSIYLFSDGYSDQFGGELGKKYMSKKFNEFLAFANGHVMEEQQYLLQYEYHLWKAHEEQIDDVLVAGLKIPEAA